MLSSRAQWQPNLAALATVARPVVVELWGHGRSPSPVGAEPYHPDAYVAAFERLRARLGAERWLICGQSFGAALTLRYALDHPERILGQIFTNSTSALAGADWVARMRASAGEQADAVERGGRTAIESIPIHPAHAKRLPPAAHRALLRDAELLAPRGVAGTIRHTAPDASVRDRICDNRVPALLVCGEREARFAPQRAFAERHMPRLAVVGVDAGHAVNLEAQEAFDTAVVEFVRRRG
jgi:2-succinyl-6-hydroxy-2,4-cyclohexadiene-1-carboxylate synthase